jgi:hypothetical protein
VKLLNPSTSFHRVACKVLGLGLLAGAAAIAPVTATGSRITLYSQTSLAGSTGIVPGLFDQLGLNGSPGARRTDFFEVFANQTIAVVTVDHVTVYGTFATVGTAVIAPLVLGSVGGQNGVAVPDAGHPLATAVIPTGPVAAGKIEIVFSPGVRMDPGARLAFGVVVPATQITDATLYGTDTLPNGWSSSVPSYFNGFYATSSLVGWVASPANHYLVIEGQAPDVPVRALSPLGMVVLAAALGALAWWSLSKTRNG